MIFRLKSKLLILLVSVLVLAGAFAFLTHHPVSMSTDGHHEGCDTACQIACFSQAVNDIATVPNNIKALNFIVPTAIVLGLLAYFAIVFKPRSGFCYALGPPLYKQMEAYRL